jgi:hypothetical protein
MPGKAKEKRQSGLLSPRSIHHGTCAAPPVSQSPPPLSGSEKGKSDEQIVTEPSTPLRYPLFESVLRQKGLKLKGIYTVEDAREIFGAGKRVSRRTIQDLISTGELTSRKLPGNGRFLAEDFETYFQNSVREPQRKHTE